ncbi:MAG TPA: cytochrome c oxidase subunit 3 [Baekduia sp.]|nr:cytochrome c oxidase subunit 3 [Baekduia sp.]
MSLDTQLPLSDGAVSRTAPAEEPGTQMQRWAGHIPGELGIWIFILGDMCLYGALFGAFLYDRGADVDLFNRSAGSLHPTFGAINTMLLLTSSILVVYGVRSVRDGLSRRGPLLFRAAFACGLGFVVVKYLEYSDLLRNDLPPTENAFFTYYYVLTGIHLTHLLAGLCILAFLLRISRKAQIGPKDLRASESAASFWHVVDLLWVVLFPLLYLVR